MTFSGFIFDVDGTLVDSVPQNLLSLQETLAKIGIAVPYYSFNFILDWTAIRLFS